MEVEYWTWHGAEKRVMTKPKKLSFTLQIPPVQKDTSNMKFPMQLDMMMKQVNYEFFDVARRELHFPKSASSFKG